MAIRKFQDLDLQGKRVLVRVDYNVALENGKVAEPKRIYRTFPTLRYLLERDARVILISHLGRPKGRDSKYSMRPVFSILEEFKSKGELSISKCSFSSEKISSESLLSYTKKMQAREVLLLENLRYEQGEEKNDPLFAAALAALGDVFVQEAFGAVHRAHASTSAISKLLPSGIGFLVQQELSMLERILENPAKPFVILLGGVKVSDKIGTIQNLINKGADKILVGGALAYTFLKAKGANIGSSPLEEAWVKRCRAMLSEPQYKNCLVLRRDHWIVPSMPGGGFPDASAVRQAKSTLDENIPEGWEGVDVGPKTLEIFKQEIQAARTIFWNGPVGLIEVSPFEKGSSELATVIANRTKAGALTVLGGGDTIHAISKAGLEESAFTHVSTGGGAALEFLEGKPLPGILNGA